MLFFAEYLQLAYLHCVGRKVLGSAPLRDGKLSAKMRAASGGAGFVKGFAVFCLVTGSAQADCFGSLVLAAAVAASFALLAAPPIARQINPRGESHLALRCDSQRPPTRQQTLTAVPSTVTQNLAVSCTLTHVFCPSLLACDKMASKAAAAAASRAQSLQSQRDAVANESEQGSSLWEQMQRSELAAAAAAAGMRVSDYEAQQQLDQAIHESTASDAPAETSAATEQAAVAAVAADSEANMVVAADSDSDDDDDCDDTASSVSSIDPAATVLAATEAVAEAADTEPSSEQPEDRNIMLELSDDALRRIMLYLEPEAIAQCCIVHKHWTFGRDEGLCEELCRRIYLQQTRKHSLSVTRWKSWRRMLINRPRLRTSGMYILRHSHMKKPQIDMFTEIKRGTVLECIYYR
jgi:hypothetical protein